MIRGNITSLVKISNWKEGEITENLKIIRPLLAMAKKQVELPDLCTAYDFGPELMILLYWWFVESGCKITSLVYYSNNYILLHTLSVHSLHSLKRWNIPLYYLSSDGFLKATQAVCFPPLMTQYRFLYTKDNHNIKSSMDCRTKKIIRNKS